LNIQPPGERGRKFLKVDWLSPEKYKAQKGSVRKDAAAVVACFRPFGTARDVTTIIIAGYTGRSTLFAAEQATDESLPELDPSENPGRPCFSVLKFEYNDRTRSEQAKKVSKTWAPPWREFFS
jgi:hypothetical protein